MKDPEKNIGIIEVDNEGKKYRILWGLENNARPTSELPTHLMNHEVKKENTEGVHRDIPLSYPKSYSFDFSTSSKR